MKRWIKIGLGVLGAIFLLGIIGAIVGPDPPAPTNTAAQPSATEATSIAPLPAPPSSEVPAADATSPSPAAAAEPQSHAPVAADPDRELCRLSGDNGGTYYAAVNSAAWHNFAFCMDGTVMPAGFQPLDVDPTADVRCYLPNDFVERTKASVTIISGTKKADLAAAKETCSYYHGIAP